MIAMKNEVERQSLLLYGFGLFIAWMYATLNCSFLPNELEAYRDVVQAPAFFTYATPVLVGAVVLFIGIKACAFARFFSRPAVLVVVGIAALGLSFAMMFLGRETLERHIASFAMHVLLDCLLLSWMIVFSRFDLEVSVRKIPGIIIACTLGIVTATSPAIVVSVVAFALCAVVQIACLTASMRFCGPDGFTAAQEKTAALSKAFSWRQLAIILAMTVLFCLVSGFFLSLRRFHGRAFIHAAFDSFFLMEVTFLLYLVTAVVVVNGFRDRERIRNSYSASQLVALVACPIIVGLCVAVADQRFILPAVGTAGYQLSFMVVIILLCMNKSQAAFQLYAYAQAVYSFCSAITNGFVAVLIMVPKESQLTFEIMALMVAGQIVVAIGFMVLIVMRRRLDARRKEAERESDSVKTRASSLSAIAERYQLSDRENEVMGWLIKGRSVKFIAEKMFLSTGTVNTYLYRIYQKMGIHSRQELLNLFEEERTAR